MTLQRILFPTDFSEPSQACLVTAASLAQADDAELFLLHVEQPQSAVTGGGIAPYPMPVPTTKEAEAKLNAMEVRQGIRCSKYLVRGSASTEIAKFAKEHDIDMIVMGTHGRTGLSRVLMGSVAEAVVRKAPCPVLTLKQPMEVPVVA